MKPDTLRGPLEFGEVVEAGELTYKAMQPHSRHGLDGGTAWQVELNQTRGDHTL